MPIDAIFLEGIVGEIADRVIGQKIDKIFQPEREEIILALRGAAGSTRLLLSAAPGSARLSILSENRENPAVPPMFCMFLRKILGSGVVREMRKIPGERMVEIGVDSVDELGELRRRRVMLELVGRQPNLVLLDEENRIIDCIRRIEGDIAAGKRQLLPGMFYRAPDPQSKRNLLSLERDELLQIIAELPQDIEIERALMTNFAGISPLAAREFAYRVGGDTAVRLTDDRLRETLATQLFAIVERARDGGLEPWLLKKDGEPVDFCYMEITQYGEGYECTKVPSFSSLLEEFYAKREYSERIRLRGREMTKTVTNALERATRKLETRRAEMAEAKDRERLRELGDLLMANLHLVERGAKSVKVVDFYDENNAEVEISLDPKINAQQNASKFYRDYARRKNAEKMLTTLISEGETEQTYLKSVLNELRSAESDRELSGIREELVSTGYLRPQSGAKKRKSDALPPREFVSSGGFRIQVGRNNLQNDQLTLKEAHKNDVWLHVQHAHGAHVLIRCGADEPDDATYTEAGEIAAFYSDARGGANVAVDYTRARYVKKMGGGKPGMVVYDPYFTMYVTPDESRLRALEQKR